MFYSTPCLIADHLMQKVSFYVYDYYCHTTTTTTTAAAAATVTVSVSTPRAGFSWWEAWGPAGGTPVPSYYITRDIGGSRS